MNKPTDVVEEYWDWKEDGEILEPSICKIAGTAVDELIKTRQELEELKEKLNKVKDLVKGIL